MHGLQQGLLTLFVLLLPFQDSGLQGTPLQFLGASPAFIPLVLLVAVRAIAWLARGRWAFRPATLVVPLYMGLITAAFFLARTGESHGEDLSVKALKLFLLTGLFLYPVFFIDYGRYAVARAVRAAFIAAVLGVVVVDGLGLDHALVHAHENANVRARGFALESSLLGAQAVTLGLLACHLSPGRWAQWGYMALTLSVVAISGSKGTALALPLALLVTVLADGRWSWRVKGALVLATMAAVWGVADAWLLPRWEVDLSEFTSYATRGTMAIAAVMILLDYPLGVGFGGFLPTLADYLPAASALIADWAPVTPRLTEVDAYLLGASDQAVNTKSFVLDFGIFFGWPFLVAFGWLHVRLLAMASRSGSRIASLLIAYSALALLTYVPGLGLYNFSLVYGVLWHGLRRTVVPRRQSHLPLPSARWGTGRHPRAAEGA